MVVFLKNRCQIPSNHNDPLIAFYLFVYLFISFDFLKLSFWRRKIIICCSETRPAALCPKEEQEKTKTAPLENVIFLFLILRSIRSGQRWGSTAICLFIYFIDMGGKSLRYQQSSLRTPLHPCRGSHLI